MPASKRTEEAEALICKALGIGLNYKSAAQLAGVTDRTVQNWRKDEVFSLRCERAIAEGKFMAASVLANEMLNGGRKAVTAAIFWLKTRTEEFREKRELDPQTQAEAAEAFVRMLQAAKVAMDATVPNAPVRDIVPRNGDPG